MKKNSKKKALSDERFAHIRSDPKFDGIKTSEKKVVIEKRFSSLLTDEKFADATSIDRRGKPLRKKKNNLNELYTVEQNQEKDEESKQERKPRKKQKKGKLEEQVIPEPKISDGSESEEEEDDDDGDGDNYAIKVDLARGEGNISSSDDDSESEESDWELPADIENQLDIAHLDSNAEQVEWASRRLAACNLNWDLVKAEDLFILVNSFVPTGGKVEKISIYLSDFGKERLEEEDKLGPRLHLSKPIEDYDENAEMDEETKIAVRKYHIDKLKYYYAIIECDEEATATSIYENCDGFLFEDSGLKMDLRFVPDDMDFDEDRLKEQMFESDVNTQKYKSKDKIASAMTYTGAKLQWDEDNELRTINLREAFKNDGANISGLIASDSEDEETIMSRRNALLSMIDEKPKQDRLKISWNTNSDNDSGEEDEESDSSDIEKALAKRNDQESSDEEIVPDIKQAKESEKPKKKGYETYLAKRKEKRKERKQQMREARELAKEERECTDEPRKKKKEKTRAELKEANYGTASAVLADDRFKALLTDSAFAIEQTEKHAKGSKLIELQAQAKKFNKVETKKEPSLVDSLKNKAEKWNSKKRK